jgi:hypothetical protein
MSPACGGRSGLTSTHSASCVFVRADAMTMCPGTGLLSHVIEPGAMAGSCRWGERTRGLATLAGLMMARA